jgi:hypothetical protein
LLAIVTRAVAAYPGAALSLTDGQIAEHIVRQSRADDYATDHPCACPDDLARNESMCGRRSAYSRPGGAAPECYPQDITASDIAAYKAAH